MWSCIVDSDFLLSSLTAAVTFSHRQQNRQQADRQRWIVGEGGFGVGGGGGWYWWWGGLWWCGGLSKHGQDNWGTTKQPAGKPQHRMLRQNTKWSRLQYYPAFTTPTVWGNLYDESWRDSFFCITLCFSFCFCLCLFSLSPPILYVILNELLCAPSAASLHSYTSTSSILLLSFCLLSSSLLPSLPSSVLSIPLPPPFSYRLSFSLSFQCT